MKKTVEESDSEKSKSSETELEQSTKKETYNTKGKLFTSHLTGSTCITNIPHI